MRRTKAKRRKLSPADRLLRRVGWRRALHHSRAAADDLAHLHFEREIAAFGKSLWRRTSPEREARRHREAIAAAVLHLGHRFGKTGKHHGHCERLRTAVILARVEHPSVVKRTDVVHQRSVTRADRLPRTSLDRAELEPAC